MAENPSFEIGVLGTRLNHLFATVHPAERGPYSNEEVARAVRAMGGDISKAYIAYLRNGQRRNPTVQHVTALAAFFGVPPAYFFDADTARDTDSALERVVALRESGLGQSEWEALRDRGVTKLAARAQGLSPRGLLAATRIIDQIRTMEGLPAADDA
ncbi:helix-turn-helix transcriptional regulator [Streptomyces sp. NPDC001941]|uniref:helix-turn-helix domain-containing protein n=1 Tax=Streptomyces sp. NPDC001941 TaxID=3154659 RepID=UPI003330B388